MGVGSGLALPAGDGPRRAAVRGREAVTSEWRLVVGIAVTFGVVIFLSIMLLWPGDEGGDDDDGW